MVQASLDTGAYWGVKISRNSTLKENGEGGRTQDTKGEDTNIIPRPTKKFLPAKEDGIKTKEEYESLKV